MSELKPCPFCGCVMYSDEDYFIAGNHLNGCYFSFVDNQSEYDFTKQETLKQLHLAWNRRYPNENPKTRQG